MGKTATAVTEAVEELMEEQVSEEQAQEERTEEQPGDGLARVSVLSNEAVNVLLGQINNLRAEAARIKANATYLARQKEQEADALVERFLPNLVAFADARLDGTPDSEVRLLNGSLGYKKKAAVWAVDPRKEADALAWAKEHCPNAVKTGIDRTALTFRFAVSDRGEVTDRHTGEVLAWAKGMPSDKVFFVK